MYENETPRDKCNMQHTPCSMQHATYAGAARRYSVYENETPLDTAFVFPPGGAEHADSREVVLIASDRRVYFMQ